MEENLEQKEPENIETKIEEKTSKKEKTKKSSKVKTFFKILAIIILIILLLAIGVGIGGYIYLQNMLGKVNHVDIDKNSIEINEGVKEELEEHGYRTIALFGVDSRSNKLESGTRSDCIILAVIDKETKKVSLVSVYRDSYLQIQGRSIDKVTHAYAYGGAQLSMSTLNTNLDLDITEFATVNFNSLSDIVDSIGGISMEITSEEVKYINGYIDETSKVSGKTSEHITEAGTYTLDGVQAVSYSRIRYTAGGGYKRAERMRTVLSAIITKAKGLSVGELNNLANKLLPEIYTNIDTNEIISMLPQLATYSVSESKGWPYEVKGATISKVWYGVPVTLEENVKKLHQDIYSKQTDYKVSNKVKEISNQIIKKTGYK